MAIWVKFWAMYIPLWLLVFIHAKNVNKSFLNCIDVRGYWYYTKTICCWSRDMGFWVIPIISAEHVLCMAMHYCETRVCGHWGIIVIFDCHCGYLMIICVSHASMFIACFPNVAWLSDWVCSDHKLGIVWFWISLCSHNVVLLIMIRFEIILSIRLRVLGYAMLSCCHNC